MFTKIMKLLTALCLSILVFTSVSQAQTCTPAPIGLISWWMADGNALDARSGANGTLRNSATFGAGQVGQAIIFDGIDDSVDTSGSPISSLNFNANDFTIEAWTKTSSTGTTRTIYGNGYNLDPVVLLRIEADNRARFLIRDNAGTPDDVLGTTTTLNDGSWHHIAAVRQGTTAKLFVDGVLENSVSNSTFGSINSVCDFAFIGGFNSGGVCAVPANEDFFNGSIDEVSVYNRALSQPEIQAIFNAGTAGKCKPVATIPPAGMVSWWPGDGNPNDIQDGNSPTSTIGTPTFVTAEVSQGMKFDGASGYRIPDNANLNFNPVSSFSYETWLRVDQVPTNTSVFLEKRNFPGPSGYVLGVEGTTAGPLAGHLFVVIQSNGTVASLDSLVAADGNFHHLAAVVDRTAQSLSLYVDGVLQGSTAINAIGSLVNTGNLYVGINTQDFAGSTAVPFNGVVDELTLYNRALTPSEVTSIFNAGAAGKQKPLAPTAAHVSVSGRVTDINGNGLSRTAVAITGSDGIMRTTSTNAFGYYEISGVESGKTYVVEVKHKGYTFAARAVNVGDDLLHLDFIALTGSR